MLPLTDEIYMKIQLFLNYKLFAYFLDLLKRW